MVRALLTAAVEENAAWCDVYCRVHGVTGVFGPRAWTSPARTPEFYPDAVTLTPSATAADVLPLVDTSAAGLSNFTGDDWSGAVAAVSAAFPGLPVVGYEHGDALSAALAWGAEPLGPLRVLLLG